MKFCPNLIQFGVLEKSLATGIFYYLKLIGPQYYACCKSCATWDSFPNSVLRLPSHFHLLQQLFCLYICSVTVLQRRFFPRGPQAAPGNGPNPPAAEFPQ